MNDVEVKDPSGLDAKDPVVVPGYRLLKAAEGLGVRAFGLGLIELSAGCDRYPVHDHLVDGQEEVYAVLRGSAVLEVGTDAWILVPGTLARVGPTQLRKLVPGPDGALVLALGGTPGLASPG